MCGLAGFISKNLGEPDLLGMTACMQHRGPDAGGHYFDAATGLGLGHRRLSILDLSEAGNQPFYSASGRYVMIYNGEVYNFREIASKYKIRTRTSSDTEVIIESFASHGIDAIRELNGMFSIVIWDKQDQRLWLFRDRVGIKPLYYHYREGMFGFSSELKSLFTLPIPKEINTQSVINFLHLGYIPGEETIYTSCRKLKPGHYASIDANGLVVAPWWRLEEKLKPAVISDEKQAFDELDSLVRSSVEYCMIADVPVGIFLSGGVDSSLVAATAQSVSSLPVKTFSIAFEEAKFNESKYARQVADHIGSNHHEFTVTEKSAVDLVNGLLDVYDEPYADSSAIPTMMVSKLARQEVTVALSGDGGDELFMGYGFYYWARRLQHPMTRLLRSPLAASLKMSGKDRLVRGAGMFEYPADARKSHIFSQEQYYFTEKEIDALVKTKGRVRMDQTVQSPRRLSWAEEQSFFDIKNYLPEELLVKTDRASMKHSLEVRVPLLDHRLVEFAINLDENLKLRKNTGKYLLKEVLYKYVPRQIFDRPKWGFAVPLSGWLKNDLRYLFDKYLNDQVVEECGLVEVQGVRALKEKYFGGRDFLYTRLWALIVLHKWFLEKHR